MRRSAGQKSRIRLGEKSLPIAIGKIYRSQPKAFTSIRSSQRSFSKKPNAELARKAIEEALEASNALSSEKKVREQENTTI